MINNKKKTNNRNPEYRYFQVTEKGTLLPFLFEQLKDKSKTTVKSFLSHRQIAVNDIITTQYDTPLNPGDTVSLNQGQAKTEFKHSMLKIVYEDDYLLVVDKKNGLLSMASDKERIKTAYYILSQYLKSQNPANRIFIVHRLDRETSGLMLFAKSMDIQHTLQQNWKELVSERKYVAVVKGSPEKDEGTISSYLAENSVYTVYSTQNPEKGEHAVTHYKVLQKGAGNTLLELELETGKKNQIRVHMKDIGCPIIGDKKYGGPVSPINRIALHAKKIRFIHPVTHKEFNFDTNVPKPFLSLLK